MFDFVGRSLLSFIFCLDRSIFFSLFLSIPRIWINKCARRCERERDFVKNFQNLCRVLMRQIIIHFVMPVKLNLFKRSLIWFSLCVCVCVWRKSEKWLKCQTLHFSFISMGSSKDFSTEFWMHFHVFKIFATCKFDLFNEHVLFGLKLDCRKGLLNDDKKYSWHDCPKWVFHYGRTSTVIGRLPVSILSNLFVQLEIHADGHVCCGNSIESTSIISRLCDVVGLISFQHKKKIKMSTFSNAQRAPDCRNWF